MASLGSFSVDIRAGIATLQSDLGKANLLFERNAEQMKKTAAATGAAIGAALAAGAATAAVAIRNAVNRMDDISKTAQRIGIATNALSGLEFAARLSDVSLEQLSGGVLRLTKNIGEAAAGNKILASTFAAIGIATTNSDGSLRNTESVLNDVAAVFKALPDGAEKSKLAIDLFGRSGAQLIPLLNAGRDGLAAMTEEARALGIVFDAEAGKQAEEFNDAITRVQAGLQGAATQIGIELLPKLTEMTGVLQSEGFRDGFSAIIEGAATATIKVAELVAGIGNLTRFAADEVAARVAGPNMGDTVRIEDAIERQREQLEFMRGGLLNSIFPPDDTSPGIAAATAELARLEELLRLSTEAAEENAIAEQNRKAAGEENTAAIGENANSTNALLEALRKLREEQGAEAESARGAAEVRRASTQAARDAQRAIEAATRSAAEAQQRAAQSAQGLNQLLRQQSAALGGPIVQASQRYAEELEYIAKLERDMLAIGPLTLQQQNALKTAREQANALWILELEDIEAASDRTAQAVESIVASFSGITLADEIRLVTEALEEAEAAVGDAFDPAKVEGLKNALGNLRQESLQNVISGTQEILGALKGVVKEGSKEMKALELAQHALNLSMAIGGIVNQANGDPYTAWARMAAMAVTMAGYIGQNFGGSAGFTNTAEERQQTQGTGTVLGDAEAKSQSIANATQITADATTALVGINRGMLQALQQLQGGLDRAGGMLARGAGQAPFTEIGGSFRFADNFLGGALSFAPLDPLNLLGGSSQITDQGLAIGGGSLSDVGVQAFQEQQYRRWRFGSRRTREEMAPVGEEFASQFQLIVDSITETVRQGAIALGMVPAEVEAALEAFRLAEIRISLKDLSAEEQQAELLAVFSQIFDNLAGSVVPYIEQFQRVGEGLGETLVRVATTVQVTQEAVRRLGFGMEQLDPERFAQVAVALVDMVGGIDAFIQSMQSFVDKFAPEAHKFEIAQDELTRAFAEAGLVLPTTRDGMWALMQSLDATTEAGQAQIATLLRLTNTADAYYTMLERRAPDAPAAQFDAEAALRYADAVADINRQLSNIDGTSDFVLSLRDIAGQYNANVARLNELARAAGLAGALEEDLARAMQLSTMQRMRAIQALEEEARALVRSLGLDALGMLDSEIAALQAVESQASSAVSSFGDAMGEAAQAASDAVNLLLGDLSPLRDSQKLQIAMDALRAGQVGPEDVLRIARRMFASGQDYRSVFDQVMQIGDRRDQGGGSVGGGGPVGSGVSPEMQALLDRRAELEAQQRASERFMQAGQLAQMIADLAGARGEDFETIAQSLGLTGLDQLLTDLQLDNVGALTDYLTALQADSYTLEDLAATVTAGEQLIVDTLRDIFEIQALVDRVGQRAADALTESDTRIEDMEIPERIAESSEPVQEEIRMLRDQVRELTEAMRQVVANTGATAGATGALAETVSNRDLVDTSIAPRSGRLGRGAEFVQPALL